METSQSKRKSNFRNIQNFSKHIFHFLSKILSQLILSSLLVLLIFGVSSGFYIHNHFDDPMTYTPYPVSIQPPEGLTLRQFFTNVDAYYDDFLEGKFKEEFRVTQNIPRKILNDHYFSIQQMILSPFLVGAIAKDTVATIYPESIIAEHMGQKDFHQHVEPLLGKYDEIKDLPEVLLLQIQANYWYVFGNEFNDYYQRFGLSTLPNK